MQTPTDIPDSVVSAETIRSVNALAVPPHCYVSRRGLREDEIRPAANALRFFSSKNGYRFFPYLMRSDVDTEVLRLAISDWVDLIYLPGALKAFCAWDCVKIEPGILEEGSPTDFIFHSFRRSHQETIKLAWLTVREQALKSTVDAMVTQHRQKVPVYTIRADYGRISPALRQPIRFRVPFAMAVLKQLPVL